MEYHSTGTLPLLGSPRYCPGANSASGYLCQTGHCCGETGCCTYYYELWWFWLLWSVLILFSCCCAYRHRQAKQRVQQQQRQREINLMAYHGACSYPSSMLDLSFLASLKLPSYEEVAAQPSTPPPPYSSVAYPRGSAHPGPSHMLSSQSSDNYTSCSCDSCCPSSPCSSSPSSAQLTDETDTSHTSTPSHSEAVPINSISVFAHSTAASEAHGETVSTPPLNEPGPNSSLNRAESMEVEISDSASLDCNGNRTVKTVTNQAINNNKISNADETTKSNETINTIHISNTSDITNASQACTITESNTTQSNLANDISSVGQTSNPSPTRDTMISNTTDLGLFQPPSNTSQNIPAATRPTVAVPPSSPPSCSPISPPSPSLPPPLFPLTDPLGAVSEQQSSPTKWEGPVQERPPTPPPQSPPRPVLFSPDFLEPERRDSAVCDLDVDQTHFQQRRLTGDSGIEVCRCRIDQEEEEDEEDEERDHLEADCSVRAQLTPSTGDGLVEWPDMCSSAPSAPTKAEAVVIAMETI
ncbi:mucin-2 [Pygocentrus nattereri]|uniref:Uncharacterized protein n=1 Tax=Pygocentrus nattereri TaxID=42514 RepID=A0A3B4D3H9_PYGNA|nr:mucin-2 [Pygocentrus nattereri]XP_017567014.1 mucin-2 [Pygocentrus nattereri]